MDLNRENNSFGIELEPGRIREHIQLGTRREGGLHGVIDAPGNKIAGSIGVIWQREWFAKNYHWQILWFFVLSEYRSRHYDEALITWARRQRDDFSLRYGRAVPLIDAPFSRVRLPAKLRLWRRWGEQIGGIFLIR